GETEEDFLETCRMVEEVGFSGVHLFPYSRREGTHAAGLAEAVPPHVIAERMTRLAAIADQVQSRWQEGFIGQEVEVLTERTQHEGRPGHTPHGLKVEVAAETTAPNQRWRVLVEGQEEGRVFGSLVQPL
ncbi:MAG TPA: hypothetical protein V6D05_17015, partial [Stenomitos sp.]